MHQRHCDRQPPMTKRIAFVINQLGGIGSGGSDRVVSVLANELVTRGWAVDILALTGDSTVERDLAPEIGVRFERPISSTNKFLKVGLRMLRGAGLVRSYARTNPEATIVSFIAWVNMCTIAGTRAMTHGPVILSERTDPASDPSSRLARWLRDASYRRASALVFQTPDARAYFAELTAAPSEVIPNPATPGLPHRRTPRGGEEHPATDRRIRPHRPPDPGRAPADLRRRQAPPAATGLYRCLWARRSRNPGRTRSQPTRAHV